MYGTYPYSVTSSTSPSPGCRNRDRAVVLAVAGASIPRAQRLYKMTIWRYAVLPEDEKMRGMSPAWRFVNWLWHSGVVTRVRLARRVPLDMIGKTGTVVLALPAEIYPSLPEAVVHVRLWNTKRVVIVRISSIEVVSQKALPNKYDWGK